MLKTGLLACGRECIHHLITVCLKKCDAIYDDEFYWFHPFSAISDFYIHKAPVIVQRPTSQTDDWFLTTKAFKITS